MERLRAVVHGTVLMLIIGWLMTLGKDIFVAAVLGAVIVYVIVGLAQALGRLPLLGPKLPQRLRYVFSMVLIGLAFTMLVYLIIANKERAVALAPQYQESLLAAIQGVAVYFGIEQEPHKWIPTIDAFALRWEHDREAFAVMTHDIFERLAAGGLPMTEIARNRRYVIVEKPAASTTTPAAASTITPATDGAPH